MDLSYMGLRRNSMMQEFSLIETSYSALPFLLWPCFRILAFLLIALNLEHLDYRVSALFQSSLVKTVSLFSLVQFFFGYICFNLFWGRREWLGEFIVNPINIFIRDVSGICPRLFLLLVITTCIILIGV